MEKSPSAPPTDIHSASNWSAYPWTGGSSRYYELSDVYEQRFLNSNITFVEGLIPLGSIVSPIEIP